MRLRRPTAGERKEGREGGGKRRGCQGGTALGSSLLPKIVYVCVCVCVCVCVFFFTQRVLSELPLYYLRSGGICASQCIFWESRVGKFVYWASFKTFTLQNCVFSRQPQFSKTGAWLVGPNTLFNMLFCTIPAGHDQAFNLQYICPLAHCKVEARFNAQQ